MELKEISVLIKDTEIKAFKEEAKKQGLKLGRCPITMTIAKMLPDENLINLAKK